jgi:hypothetical protein
MSSGLIRMLFCLSLMLSNVVFSVFLNMTLCILLGCRLRVFLYFEIVFLQLIEVCLVIISLVFFLVVFPMVPSSVNHPLTSSGSFGGFGIFVYWWFCKFVIMLWVLQLLFRMMIFIAFLMMWYVDSSFFHCFWSFMGKNPPCLDACSVSVGIGGAVHVSSIILEILFTMSSICVHTCCHWLWGNFVLLCKVSINWYMRVVFVSENWMRNLLMFSGGMGFSILGLESGLGRYFLAIMLLGGI